MKKIITISLILSIFITIAVLNLNMFASETKNYKTTLNNVTHGNLSNPLSEIVWSNTAKVNGISFTNGSTHTFSAFNLTADCAVTGTYKGVTIYKGSASNALNIVGDNTVDVEATKQDIAEEYEDIIEKFENANNIIEFKFKFEVEEMTATETETETATETTTPTATETVTETPTSTSTSTETTTPTATPTETETLTATPIETATETTTETETVTPACTSGKYVINVSGNINSNIQIMQGEFEGKITQKMLTSNINSLGDTKICYNGKWSRGFKLNQGYNEIDVNGEKVKINVRRAGTSSLTVTGINSTSSDSSDSSDKSDSSDSSDKSYYTYSSGKVLPKTGESTTNKLTLFCGGIALICLGTGLFIVLKKKYII